MKPAQAILCLLIIIIAGFIISAIFQNTETSVSSANMPEVEIIWNEGQRD